MANRNGKGSDPDFKAKFFNASNKLPGNLEPSDCKHITGGRST